MGKVLSVGDRVEITKEGANAHLQHHDSYADAIAKVSTSLGTVAKAAKQIAFTFPEPGFKGSIVEVRERWFWQSGYDYLVKWDDGCGQSWHLSKHLLSIE